MMTIVGQNDFLECFHNDTPIISFDLNFLEYSDVQSLDCYPTESFCQQEILEKQWRIKLSRLSRKSYGCHGNIREG